jgi:hypothetical protein
MPMGDHVRTYNLTLILKALIFMQQNSKLATPDLTRSSGYRFPSSILSSCPLLQNTFTTSVQTIRIDSIKDFDILQLLGEGGAATVSLARLRATDKLYAIKRSRRSNEGSLGHTRAELDALSRITDLRAPFLVGMHSFFQSGDHDYFVLVSPFSIICSLLAHRC